ncbi:unnamed protein product [Musa banksii]
MLSISGAFLLCCNFLCPCFRSKCNDISEDPVLGGDSSSCEGGFSTVDKAELPNGAGCCFKASKEEKNIIHRDVKASNILLTEGFTAKVADYGFATSGPTEKTRLTFETKVKGTAGYTRIYQYLSPHT